MLSSLHTRVCTNMTHDTPKTPDENTTLGGTTTHGLSGRRRNVPAVCAKQRTTATTKRATFRKRGIQNKQLGITLKTQHALVLKVCACARGAKKT